MAEHNISATTVFAGSETAGTQINKAKRLTGTELQKSTRLTGARALTKPVPKYPAERAPSG